jgi:hypothetical protein
MDRASLPFLTVLDRVESRIRMMIALLVVDMNRIHMDKAVVAAVVAGDHFWFLMMLIVVTSKGTLRKWMPALERALGGDRTGTSNSW